MMNTLIIFILATFNLTAEVVKKNIKNECLANKKYYIKPNKKDYKVDCYELYHHYYKDKMYSPNAKNLKISAFNMYRMGEKESRFKSYELMAEMIVNYQLDIVAGIELYPQRGEDRKSNNQFFKLVKYNQINSAQAKKLYRESAYLKLLDELNKIDPDQDWSLVVSSESQGANAKSQEVLGFYYKATRVKPKENAYCKQEYENQKIKKKYKNGVFACLPYVSDYDHQFIAKIPMIASFEAGSGDYTMLSTHQRSRSPKNEILEAIKDEYFNGQMPAMNKLLIGRTAELSFAVDVMNEIKEINQDQDVMLMGDFNIEVPTSNLKAHRFWKKLIGKDRRIHVEDYTTLSDQRLTSRYDHFIIDAKESSECELPEYPVLDLTIPEVFADAINISYSYDNMKGLILDQRNKYRKSLLEKTIVFDGKNEDIDYIYRPTNIDDNETIEMKRMLLDDEMSIFDERITNPYFDDENMFAVVKNLFSDHLPILIECDASSDKD